MKLFARTLLLTLLLPLLLSGCKSRGFQDIAITSIRLVSIVPEGFSDVTAVVEVGVHNPTVAIQLSQVEAQARFQGEPALSATSETITIPRHSDSVYLIPLRGRLSEGFNPFRLLRLLGDEASFDDITLDVRCRASLRSGFGRNIELLDIPLSTLLRGMQTQNDEQTLE